LLSQTFSALRYVCSGIMLCNTLFLYIYTS
jgi:hypothetical protein